MRQQLEIESLKSQFGYFPGTRYMGSKNKIIGDLWNILKGIDFTSFYDAFGGSNIVGYFMKCQNKEVITNDFMSMSYHISKALIENKLFQISDIELDLLVSRELIFLSF